jgi:hypothetical protein
MTTGLLETDILTDELLDKRKVTINQVWDVEFSTDYINKTALQERGKNPSEAVDVYDFYDLVRRAIRDLETRTNINPRDYVRFTEEEPDAESTKDTITVSLVERIPGSYSKGAVGKAQHRVQTERHMEELDDDENPGYRMRMTGLFFDNIVRFTCWATTNKKANSRAKWFEKFMDDYIWWFRLMGTGRILWQGQGSDIVQSVNDTKWYGRPIEDFIQTQRIKVFRQKTIDEVLINMATYVS